MRLMRTYTKRYMATRIKNTKTIPSTHNSTVPPSSRELPLENLHRENSGSASSAPSCAPSAPSSAFLATALRPDSSAPPSLEFDEEYSRIRRTLLQDSRPTPPASPQAVLQAPQLCRQQPKTVSVAHSQATRLHWQNTRNTPSKQSRSKTLHRDMASTPLPLSCS